MKNRGKYRLCFSSKTFFLLCFMFVYWPFSFGQSSITNLKNEYASSLFVLEDYNLSAIQFNKNIDSTFNLIPYSVFAVIANSKIKNTEYRDKWAEKLIKNDYRRSFINYLNNVDISQLEKIEILKVLDSIYLKNIGKIIKETDFELEDRITEMLNLDQFVRKNAIEEEIWGMIDSQYIFSGVMDLMLSDIDGSHLSRESKFALAIILLHQADYIEQFNKMCDLELIEKMLYKNIISPIDYAKIYNRNCEARKVKIKYGIDYANGHFNSIVDFDLAETNKNRLKIGLCELQFDFRNLNQLMEDKNEIKAQILERLKKLNDQ